MPIKKEKKLKSIEKKLWKGCNKFRGSSETQEFKYGILSLIFLECINDKFKEQRKKILLEQQKKDEEIILHIKDNICSMLFKTSVVGIPYEN